MISLTRALITALLLIFGIQLVANATNMDLSTYNQVIDRLEVNFKNISDKSIKTNASIRLADLYADKARLLQMQEVEKLCDNCLKSKDNRNKAIHYYQVAFQGAKDDQLPRILLQIAHLYTLNAELGKAERIFKNIISDKKRRPQKLVGEAYAGLGEIQFAKGMYKKAKYNFNQALKRPIGRPAYVRHRLAWCYFNEGKAATAKNLVVKTIRSDEKLTTDMQKDLAKDLATFIARVGITESSIDELLELSPQQDKRANLFYLGKEADRLGNRNGALLVWDTYADMGGVSQDESLEIKLRTAQNLWDQGASTASLKKYKEFYSAFGSPNCEPGDICAELKDRARMYVHTWIKKEKTNPTKNLQEALRVYVKNNPSDVEMIQWTGHVSRYIQDYASASLYYGQAADEASRQNKQKALRASLLAEVETAEDTEKLEIKERAYLHYLKLSERNKQYDEIKYQLAYLAYEKKDFEKAQKEFDVLARASKLNDNMKIKAADLSLDSLALLKDKERLEKRAKAYSRIFKSKRTEYTGIARKAGVNIALEMHNSNPDKALKKLIAISLVGASKEEKLNFYRNKVLVAESAQDLNSIDSAARGILRIKGISQDEKEYALSKRLMVAEAQLNFRRAHNIAKDMKLSSLSAENRALKRALLAELAGKSSKKYYDKYIKLTPSRRKANVIRAKYVLESRNPWRTLKKYKWKLYKTPDIYADLLVDVYAKQKNASELESHIKLRKIRRTDSGKILKTFLDLRDFDNERKAIVRLRLDRRSDARLARSLNKRVNKLQVIDRLAKRSVERSRFPVQARYYNLLSREYKRLYKEVMNLPAPRGLKKSQRAEYKRLLKQQAQPFLVASENAERSESKLWSNSKDYETMLDNAENVRGGHATLLRDELNSLLPLASTWQKGKIKRALGRIDVPSRREARKALQIAKKNPFDNDALEKLKELESRRGRRSMVAFLEARILEIQKEKK
jgi:tetratricopeptide (TPR) repeat protein